jgi:hypothetical protein
MIGIALTAIGFDGSALGETTGRSRSRVNHVTAARMTAAVIADTIDPDGVRNVLQVLFAVVGDENFELAPYLPVRILRQADAARWRNLLQSCRDVDAIAEHIALLDYNVSNIDADAELDAAVGRDVLVALCHSALHRYGAGDRLYYRRESKQQAVAGCLDDLSLMGGDKRFDQFLAVGFQGHQRTLLVRAHESRVADYISGDDRSKVTL